MYSVRPINIKEDRVRCCRIKDGIYPKKFAFLPFNDDCIGIVLVHEVEGIVGSIVLNLKNISVRDLYIIPQHIRGIKLLLTEALSEMQKYSDRWEATCRPETSLNLLKGLDRRGIIKLEIGDKSEVLWNRKPMIEVVFTIL